MPRSVRGATRRSSGNIVVADGQGAQVIEFSRGGDYLRVLGGRGEGPGEFLSPRTLSKLPGDTVAVFDPRLRRLTLFAADGEFRVVSLQNANLFPNPGVNLLANRFPNLVANLPANRFPQPTRQSTGQPVPPTCSPNLLANLGANWFANLPANWWTN